MKWFSSSQAGQKGIDFGSPHTTEISFGNERACQAALLEAGFSEAPSPVGANITQNICDPNMKGQNNKQMVGLLNCHSERQS